MSKKLIVSMLILLLIGSAITVLVIINQDSNEQGNTGTSQDNNPPAADDSDLNIDNDHDTSVQAPAEEPTTEATEPTENFGETIKDAFNDALTFFKEETHIVAIGDSLTHGVGDETDNGGYVGVLAEHFDNENMNVTLDNFGKPGNRSDQLLKRLDNEEIVTSIEEADIVLITIGANDIMKIVRDNFMDLTEEPFLAERGPYKERLEQIMDRILTIQPDTEIYLLGFYNPFEKYFSDIEALDSILTRWNNESRNAGYLPEQHRKYVCRR
ncbi:GDSL-type esterase/lipase family protein [Gracilibacillus oryzae]|uniref:GDSL-type esterase/lipase family protein n=1 Tax=Gracilibacillus oryzae TaxID=1672701 RepID=UPI001D183404|nr:GDSL-type esterase/lipase family protein [Gracilibacillus oryzae]